MISILRSVIVALSTYSIIPMPQFEWKDKDLKYSMCAFPIVGVIIAVFSFFCYNLLRKYDCGASLIGGCMTLLPLFITGGIHMDGYMDTVDAISSYGDREKRLKILKDPHVGAFAVIGAICYILLSYILWTELTKRNMDGMANDYSVYSVFSGYVISRVMSAIAVLKFKKAKNDGMVSDISAAQDKGNIRVLVVMLIVLVIVILSVFKEEAFPLIIPSASMFVYYRNMSYKHFGGITGDLAGWFVQCCEIIILMMVLLSTLIRF
ncbi:MAG: adenosylcobinamide-GDP ribazoletransferase [Lachnospiraceae bacterium]|nr:adenosylcobinamide-GDP ribazoletransferase [Lachnospiraceae bacterium]